MEPRAFATVGIVLAGGSATRLEATAVPAGGKAAVVFQGRTFLDRVCAAMASALGDDRDIFVVAAPTQVVPAPTQSVAPGLAVRVVRDTTPGAGPLAGIRDGLRAARAAAEDRGEPAPAGVVVTSCDVPLLRPDVIRLLLEEAQASAACWTVPVVHGHPQVLLSVLGSGMLPRIEAWLETGRRDPRGLLSRLAAEEPGAVCMVGEQSLAAVDPALESFFDIDTPADLERLLS